MIRSPGGNDVRTRRNVVSDAQTSDGYHRRALSRARRSEKGRPGVLAWLAGLSIHLALAVLLVT
jgi:hypothetical protein